MANSSNNGSATTSCGLYEVLIFCAAIITGTACSISSKTMMSLHGEGMDGDWEQFSKPLFQTIGMFVGMLFGLLMHWAVLIFQIPFPGYNHDDGDDNNNKTAAGSPRTSKKPDSSNGSDKLTSSRPTNYGAVEGGERDKLLAPPESSTTTTKGGTAPTPLWLYFFLAVPAIFDVGATMLCMMGLQYIDVSVYQLLRGSGIIFVALMKQHVLGDKLYTFQWIGVFWNVVSVFLVGGTAILSSEALGPEDAMASPSAVKYGGSEALLGVLLVMLGAFVQAMQFVFEEKVMKMDDAAPPLLLIGMEGFWGTLICLFILYPLAYYLPGDDHGSYEDGFNTLYMFMHSSTIQLAFVIYFFVIFGYNMFAVLVTFSLNSIWHAILDNFRPITVWATDMFIFYAIVSLDRQFGEPWTKYSWIQLAGMFVLLYGTAVYNAPNAGSIRLEGQWYVFGLHFGHEYEEVEVEMQEEELHDEWEARRQNFGQRRSSSMAEHSPYVSMHTQALRGLAAPKIYKNAKTFEKILTV